MSSETVYRTLRSRQEFRGCIDLQRETWGRDFAEVVPAGILKVVDRIGGQTAGAFDRDDRMVGFVFALPGFRDGEPILWSHMLAVALSFRGRGIGRGLKLYQRAVALERGLGRIFWTFDPLQAANAHLNVNSLGVEIVDYTPDFYGNATGSPLHPGEATDRFVVQWRLESDRVRRALSGDDANPHRDEAWDAPLLSLDVMCGPSNSAESNSQDDRPLHGMAATERELPDPGSVRIPVPCEFVALARREPALIPRWRLGTRRAFLFYLGRGYTVKGFFRPQPKTEGSEACCFYYLTASRSSALSTRGC